MTDIEILKRIKENDPRIITDLYKRYFKEIVQYLQFKFNPAINRQDAEDIYVRSFEILCGNIKGEKNTENEGSIKKYIYGICWHLACDETKRKRRVSGEPIKIIFPILDDPDWEKISNKRRKKFAIPDNPDWEENWEEKDEKMKLLFQIDEKEKLLKQIVGKLTEPCKSLLTLFWYDQKRDTEIVTLTKYESTDTVKNQRSRCMKKLKDEYLTKLVAEKNISSEKHTQLLTN
ncbi:MAG: hypothetical protein Q8M08_02720 [Bacteroidales bacterium]|nr:hypothetical protein [Bacteroidales bacterium]